MDPRFLGILYCLFLGLFARISVAQTTDSRPKSTEGGSFVFEGVSFEVSAGEIARQVELFRRLNPQDPYRAHLLIAWQRTIRLKAARHLGLTVTDEDLREFFTRRMIEIQPLVSAETGGVDPAKFAEFLRLKGFRSRDEWEEFCVDELLSEKFITREFPLRKPSEADVRARFAAMNTLLEVEAFTFAPEHLETPLDLRSDDPEAFKNFESWWNEMPRERRRLYDDDQRPALECEAIYFSFFGKSPDQVREWFETPRGEAGLPVSDIMFDVEPSPRDIARSHARWTSSRRTTYAAVESSLPPGLSDDESFERLRPFFRMEFKIYKYLERIWRELRQTPIPADLRQAARKYGLEYRHLPFLQVGVHWNDAVLWGDHPTAMVRIPEGSIFDYRTENSTFYAEGVVDQPGVHGSIFRMIRAEEMRVLPAKDAVRRAWPDFVRSAGFEKARAFAEQFTTHFGAELRKLNESGGTDEARRRIFLTLAAQEKNARWVGPYYLKPFREGPGKEVTEGLLGQRIGTLLHNRWTGYGLNGLNVQPGDVLPALRDPLRKVIVFPHVKNTRPPADGLFDRDATGRELALRSIESQWDAERVQSVNYTWAWPNINRKFSLKAPELDAVMIADMNTGVPRKSEDKPR